MRFEDIKKEKSFYYSPLEGYFEEYVNQHIERTAIAYSNWFLNRYFEVNRGKRSFYKR